MRKTIKIFTCIIGATMGSSLAYGAAPEESEDTTYGIEEIVTTARKRAENLQEVPIAVSAFNKSMLNDRAIFESAGNWALYSKSGLFLGPDQWRRV